MTSHATALINIIKIVVICIKLFIFEVIMNTSCLQFISTSIVTIFLKRLFFLKKTWFFYLQVFASLLLDYLGKALPLWCLEHLLPDAARTAHRLQHIRFMYYISNRYHNSHIFSPYRAYNDSSSSQKHIIRLFG